MNFYRIVCSTTDVYTTLLAGLIAENIHCIDLRGGFGNALEIIDMVVSDEDLCVLILKFDLRNRERCVLYKRSELYSSYRKDYHVSKDIEYNKPDNYENVRSRHSRLST